jgi:hypothetical protein
MAPYSSSIIVSGSCDGCVCIMLNSCQSIISLNCFVNNETCQFFANYVQSVVYQMADDLDTIFYFLTLPPQPITNLFWPFDGYINEIYNRMDGSSTSNISFVSPEIYGRGSAIYFNRSQYINMSSAYLNLSSNSFTFDMWISPFSVKNSSSVGSGILGQFQALNSSLCLHLEVRSLKSYLGFFNNDCTG